MMRTTLSIGLALLLISPATAPLRAHHAFEAEFDQKRQVHFKGKVTSMHWSKSHAWVRIDVEGPDGKVTNWMIECGSPNIMLRRGFTKDSLQNGVELSVEGYQAKNGANRANGSSVTFSD